MTPLGRDTSAPVKEAWAAWPLTAVQAEHVGLHCGLMGLSRPWTQGGPTERTLRLISFPEMLAEWAVAVQSGFLGVKPPIIEPSFV